MVAQELIDCLNKVTSKGQKKDRWASVWVALRTALSRDHIKNLSEKLRDFREQLTLRVLLLLNSHVSLQNQRLDALGDKNNDIIEVVSINGTVLQDLLKRQGDGFASRLDEEGKDAEQRHAETLAAILTTRGGISTTITAPDELFNKSIKQQASETLPTVTTYWGTATDSTDDVQQLLPGFKTESGQEIKTLVPRILDALHFRRIADRRATITKAYERTFQWIYSEPTVGDKPWDSFIQWLKHGKKCYWVNGKAGSGKSTLMRYISEDSRTIIALKEWAGSSQLLVGSFFFWNAGTSLQKSQTGLLRSLLLEVLTKKPEIVLTLFPDVCRSIIAGKLNGPLELSFIELQKAFSTLFSTPKNFKVCFIVDGLDEYDGDHTEICELFSQLAVSDDAKILLSSRPIPSCVHAFSNCPTLRLQDLTHNDVKRYVNGKLGQDVLMQRLEKAEPGVASGLTEGITLKASGVFLWVRLVVRSLLHGLQDYDTQSDLLRKLDELPPDLEKLYDHMMHSMSASNRQQGSKLLQLVLRSIKIQGDYPMTVLQLSFAEDEDYLSAVDKRPAPLTTEAEAWRCESTEGRLRSRCCGFLEVHDPPPSRDSTSDALIGFLHRTVIEYLQMRDVYQALSALTEDSKFDIDKALLNSSLAEMKAKPPSTKSSLEDSTAFNSMLRILTYGQHLNETIGAFQAAYLPEVLNTMAQYWPYHNKARSYDMAADAVPKYRRLSLVYPLSFIFSASYHSQTAVFKRILQFYEMAEQESRNHTDKPSRGVERDADDAQVNEMLIGRERRTFLSACMLCQFAIENVPSFRISVSRNILACRMDPNAKVKFPSTCSQYWQGFWDESNTVQEGSGWTCWEFLLNYILQLTAPDGRGREKVLVDSSILESLLTLIDGMLKVGAFVNTKLRRKGCISKGRVAQSSTIQVFSAYAIVQRWMFDVWLALASFKARSKATLTEQTGTARLDYALAEKMCIIEKSFKNSGGVIIARNVWCAPSNHKKSASKVGGPIVKAPVKYRSILQPNQSATGQTSSQNSAAEVSKGVPNTVREEIPYNELNIPTPNPSPWTIFRDSHSNALEHSNLLSPQQELKLQKQKEETLELRREKKWEQTPRLQRIELLENEEREMAYKLAMTELAPKDERQVVTQMRKLGFQKQSKIMECVNTLKESGGVRRSSP